MKKVIKTMLAFAALMLCGGAWAAAPFAVWDGDFTGSSGGFSITSNGGNTVGETIKITQNNGVVFGTENSKLNNSTYIIHSKGLAAPTTASKATYVLALHQNNLGLGDTAYNKLGLSLDQDGMMDGIWNGAIHTSGYTRSAITDTSILVINIEKSGGVFAWQVTEDSTGLRHATQIFSNTTLKDSTTNYKGFTLGGMYDKTSSNLLPATNWEITRLAVFDSSVNIADALRYRFPSEMTKAPFVHDKFLTTEYQDLGWRVSSIDDLMTLSFNGKMGGLSINSGNLMESFGYYLEKQSDGTATFEMQVKNGELKAVLVRLKVENGKVFAKAEKAAYISGKNAGMRMFSVNGSDSSVVSGVNGNTVATSTSTQAYGVAYIVAAKTVTWKNTGTEGDVSSTSSSPITEDHFKIHFPATETLPAGSVVRIRKVRFASVNDEFVPWTSGKSDFSLIRMENILSNGANGYTVNGNADGQAHFLDDSATDARIQSNSSTSDHALNFTFSQEACFVVGKTYESYTGTSSSNNKGLVLCYGNGNAMFGSNVEWSTLRYVAASAENSVFVNASKESEGVYPVAEVTAEVVYIASGDQGKTIAINFNKEAKDNNDANGNTSHTIGDTEVAMAAEKELQGQYWTQVDGRSNSEGVTVTEYDFATSTSKTIEGSSLTWSSNNQFRYTDTTDKAIRGYLDDGGSHAQVTLTGIPYALYDVTVVFATDAGSKYFSPVSVNGTKYAYIGGQVATTSSDADVFGYSQRRVIAYGQNAIRISNQSGDLTIVGGGNANGARGGIAAVVITAGPQFWTGAANDGNWNTAGNWSRGSVPTANEDVTIDVPATISVTSASVAKSLKIAADVTITGAFAGGSIKKVTFEEGATLTADVANGSESKLQNVIGGKIIKTGAGALSFGTIDGNALNGTTVEIREGKALPTIYDNVDAVMTDPTFIIGANGELTNYGWYTANGTLTIENAGDTAAFLSGSGIRGVTKIVKKGAGNLTFRSWKATNGTKEAFSCPIEIQAGRLTFFPHGAEYTVSGVISGAGGVGVVQGTAEGNWVKITGNNTYSGGTVVESGMLGLGFKNALGGQGKTLLVESGATVDVRGIVDHGSVATLHGGTIKNSTSDCGLGSVQFRSIELTADSTADLAYATGILNNGYNATSIKLNGHKLTKKGSAALYLVSVTTANAGTLRLEAGSIHFMGGNNEYPANKAPATSQITLEVAGANVGLPGNYALTFANVTVESDASLAAGTAAITVNGTLKIDGSIAKATTVASTGTLDLSMAEENSIASHIAGNLTIAIGAKLIFPTDYVENTPITLTAGTLAATSGSGQVSTDGGETFVPATITYDTEAKTVKYVTALNEYALTDDDIAAIEAKNITLGGAGIIQVATETDIAKSCTFTNVPEGYTVYGLGGKFIGVVKINYEAEKEDVLNTAALHFDASRLNTIAAGQDNAVTAWDNLGADTTRPNATVNGNGRAANNSPTLAASSNSIAIDFGECNSQMDLGWARIGGIKAVIQVIDIKADKRAFLFGDYNNGSGAYGFHRGQQNSNPYYFNGNSRIAKVYDNGVDKGNGQSQSCPAGMRVISLTATRNDVYSDCFTTDRDNCDNRSGGRKLCEVLVFTETLTDAKRVEIEDYLLRKWFNAKAVVNGVPKATIQEALDTVEDGDYTTVHTLVEPTAEEIPEGWCWKNGNYYPVFAKIGTTGFATLDDAIASIQEGETADIVVVQKVTSLTAAPAGANYTLTYTKGAGTTDSRVVFPYEGGTVTLSSDTEEDVYYTRESISGTATTINLTNAIVNYSDIFGVGQATYVIGGTSNVTAPRFILSQGAGGRTASVTIKDSAVVTVTGENDNHSNQASVMIGHWNGPSTLTIQDSAKLVVPNAGIHIGQTGNTQTINLNGGTLEAKGITMADYSNTSTLNLAGGTLKLGEMGIDKYASKVLTISMTADTTIEATAATFPLEQAISVPTDKTLTFTSSTLTTLDISNITLATGAALDLSGCTALVSVPVGMKEAVASVPFSQITMPDGAAYAVTPTHAEYANGSLTVTDVPEGVNLKVQLPGDEGLGEMTRDGTTLTYKGDVKISGYATSFDATFVHFSDDTGNPDATNTRGTLDYQELSGVNMQYDNNPVFVNYEGEGESKVATKNTGIKMKAHPYIQSISDSWWQGTRQLTLAVVGTMPTETKTIFIHMGHSYTDRTGLMIATGDKEDEVVVAWNDATTINEITRLSVPNAATARHVYIVTKNDDPEADKTTFTVYLDGMKWKTLEVTPLFTITGGVQVGSDFGGYIRGADVWHAANGETGIVNAIRLYGRVISDAEIAQYSVEAEFPYHSPKGSSARTFEAGASNWVEAESTPWSNLAKDATVAVESGSALDGSSVEATLSGAAEITVNVAAEGIAYEALNVKGAGAVTFAKGENSGAIRVTGMTTLGNAITVVPGSLDLSTSPITLADEGAITFDYTAFVPSNELATQVIPLTGDMDQADEKVTVTLPESHPNHTMVKAYNTSLKKYELTVTMTNKVLDIPEKANTTPTVTVQVGEGEPQAVEIDANGQITAAVGSTVVVTYTPNTGYFADENGVVTIESVGATSTVTVPEMPTLVKGQASVTTYTSAQDPGTKTYYKTLAQAVSVADDDATVNLEDNVALDETFVIEKNLYLNLADYSLSCSDTAVPVLRVARGCIVQIDTLSTGNITSESVAVENNGTFIVWAGSITGDVVLNWIADPLEQNQPMAWDYTQDVTVTAGVATKDVGNDIYRVTMTSAVIPLPETSYPGMGHLITAVTKEEPAKPTDDEPTVIDDPEEKVAMEPGAKVIIPETMPVENVKVVYGGIDLAKEVVDSEGTVARPKYVEVSRDADTGAVVLTTTDAAKPAATAIAMATPTEGEGEEATDKVQFTITNPIPGLFYAVSSCDEPDGDFTSATGDQATSGAEKTVSIPMTFTGDKKVKYYKVSVKATR